MIQITECCQIHPLQNKHVYGSAKLFSCLLSLSIDKTLTTVEKKVMIHDQKRNRGDEKNKARQRWKQNEIICWDYGMRLLSFLGMAQTWQAGWFVVQSILWGRWWLLFFSLRISAVVRKNIALSLRRPDQLSSKCASRAEFQKGNSFWCFTYVRVTLVEAGSNAHFPCFWV